MTKPKTTSVRVHITHEQIENLLYSARQGTDYWTNTEPNEENEVTGIGLLDYEAEMRDFMKGDLEIFVFDAEEDDKKHVLNIAKVKKGLTAMAKNERWHFANILNDECDMNTSDALIQCALFGKTIYS